MRFGFSTCMRMMWIEWVVTYLRESPSPIIRLLLGNLSFDRYYLLAMCMRVILSSHAKRGSIQSLSVNWHMMPEVSANYEALTADQQLGFFPKVLFGT